MHCAVQEWTEKGKTMELNEEIVKKALDWLDSLIGNSNDSEMTMFAYQLLGILYDTCEELTEENERLSAPTYRLREEGGVELMPTIKSIRADTVREMQERLKEHLEKPEFPWDSFTVAEEFIDQIAKEMMEGDDGTNT